MTTPEPGQFGPPIPPPQQPNPYGAPLPPQPGPYGQPAPNGYAPMPPAAAKPGNVGAAIAVGFLATLVGAAIYGYIMKATKHEIGWVAFGLALLVALPLGKIGRRNAALPMIGLFFSALGVFLGQLFGIALLVNADVGVSLVDIFTQHFSDLMTAWKDSLDIKDVLFYGIGAAEGFVLTRRLGASS